MTTTTIDTTTGEVLTTTPPANPEGKDRVYAAFINAQAEFLHVEKRSDGNRGKFASFPDVVEHIRPILNRHGLAFAQLSVPTDGAAVVRTLVLHESGQHFISGGTRIPYAKHDPQGAGSALSYAKRYDLLATCGVATDDDDGAAALAGFERERHERAKAAARAAERIDERQIDILVAVAQAVSPDTDEGKLRSRYAPVLADDFTATLEAGLEAATKRKALTIEQVDEVRAGAERGAAADAIKAVITDGAS